MIPLRLGEAPCVVTTSLPGVRRWRPEIGKAEREHTPPMLAEWLVRMARLSAVGAG